MPSDFPREFISRDAELSALESAWAYAKTGHPKFVLLLGEPGLGKTRLVHEFYKRLSAIEHALGNAYWPLELDPPESLRVNPRLSGERATADIPWLWWGLRWLQPDAHTAAARRPCAQLDTESQDVLKAHNDALDRWKAQNRRTGAILATPVEVAAGYIPVVGPLVSPTIEYVKFFWASKRWGAGRDPERRIDYDLEFAEHLRDAEEEAMRFLSSFLDSTKKELPTVPALLFLDDAQWADSVTLRFVIRLYEQAVRYRWPLLIVATHWETEWMERADELSPAQPAIDTPPNLNAAVQSEGFSRSALGRDSSDALCRAPGSQAPGRSGLSWAA